MDQNKQQQEPTFDESVRQVMKTLPPVIREYVEQGKYTDIAKSLMTTYGLRIDQTGILEREILLLLMGIETPGEFAQTLGSEARLGQNVIDRIARDVNDRVFVPLRQAEMKRNGGSVGAPTQKPSAQSSSYFHLQNKISAPARSAQAPAAPASRPPAVYGQLKSDRLLEDHEEPHIELAVPAAAPKSQSPFPAPARTMPPPPNLPGAALSGVIPPGGRPTFNIPFKTTPPLQASAAQLLKEQASAMSAPKQMPTSSPVPTASARPSTPSFPAAPKIPPAPLKPYAVDPYREPLE